jgi:quercetin dioxygenase-like cupin family protein
MRTSVSNLVDLAAIAPRVIWEGVEGRIVEGDRVAVAVVELAPEALVPEHSHDNEQLGLVVTGTVTFTIGKETKTLGPGGTWRIPGNASHTVRAGPKGAVVVDVFAPPRSDWHELETGTPRTPRWPP